MAKMVDIEKLKELLKGSVKEESETSLLEGLMGAAVDYDESAVESRIAEATKTARAEAEAEYGKRLHDMFFGGAASSNDGTVDDRKTELDEKETPAPSIDDLFTEVK